MTHIFTAGRVRIIAASAVAAPVAMIGTADNPMKALTFNKQEGLNGVGEVTLTR